MSGLFLFFDPSGISSAVERTFDERISNRITRLPDQPLEILRQTNLIGAVTHHGVLPSGGVVSDHRGQLLSTGSSWIEPDAEALATPTDLLEAIHRHPAPDRPPFQGAFAIAHGSEDGLELTVDTDYWAFYPLYFRAMGAGVAVSSSLKFLLEPGDDKPNREALVEWLTIGYLPRDHTVFENIHRLPGNSRLVCGRDGIRINSFPRTVTTRNRPIDSDVVAEYDFLISRFLRRFKGLASSYCISMSGGLDSRLLGSAALREGFPLGGFTIGEPGSLDAAMAEKFCSQVGIPLVSHQVDGSSFPSWFKKTIWFTEGRALPEHLHYMTAQLEGVVPPGPQLQGLMGELGLSDHFDSPKLLSAGPEEIRQACRDLVAPVVYWPHGAKSAVLDRDLYGHIANQREKIAEHLFSRIGFSGTYSNYVDYKYLLKGETFMNPCIMSQAIPWSDIINPFSDLPAFQLGSSLSLDGISERRGQIRWGLEHFPDIAKLPRVKAGVLINLADDDPQAYSRGAAKLHKAWKLRYNICRLSRGRINLPLRRSFPEYGSWYRRWKPVREFVDDVLLSDRTLDRGIFRRDGMRRLLGDLRVGRNTWGAVGTCLAVEIFLRQFLDGTDQPKDPVVPLGLEMDLRPGRWSRKKWRTQPRWVEEKRRLSR